MPLNAGWRGFNIVAPLTQGREEEIVGGLKNALDRGETLAKAKQSFLSAGYRPEEVEAAVQKLPAASATISQPLQAQPAAQPGQLAAQPAAQPGQPVAQAATQPLPTTTAKIPGQEKKLSKKFIIILISSAVFALIIAGLLGVFWDKIF